MYLINMYGTDVSFFIPPGSKTPTIFFRGSAVAEGSYKSQDEMDSDALKSSGVLLRECILKQDFELNNKFCDASELEKAYKDIVIPKEVEYFFSALFDFDIKRNDVDEDQLGDTDTDRNFRAAKLKKILSVYQIVFYILNNGRKRTPLHMLNSESIYNACRSKTLISSLNRFGLTISYDEVLRYHSDMASYTTETSQGRVPLPSTFSPAEFTIGAFDNFDHEEATLSGIGGSHDTVLILMQDKPQGMSANLGKPNMSETGVTHRERQFMEELGCQVLKSYTKHTKKPNLSPQYDVAKDMFKMGECESKSIRAKDHAWVVSRLDLSDLNEGRCINEADEDQTMPSWSAFNSLVTDESVAQKIIGFLPVLPYPVTEYATVYTSLKNFQDILSQLQQSHLPVACDEGVYHIAREIIMNNPAEFSDLVLCLGSFHLIKIVMGAMGKYVDGSGAETILVESKAFGQNVVRSVLDGTHYTRSLKGLLLLCECMERLQWAEFFRTKGVDPYMNELELVKLMKASVSEKNRIDSKGHLSEFLSTSSTMIDDFNAFRSERSEMSETFAFWDRFIQMSSILRDLVRADREGNWELHLHCVQAVLPLFAGCDRINYLRWGSVYLEDMRRLEECAPSVYENFKAGKFVVKWKEGRFNSVGADMCLEQTINRSQKSAGGIIGSTKRKQFVTQWEIIYHEMLSVVNVQHELSGVATPSTELLVNHEFNLPATRRSEALIQDMIEYIRQHDNPVVIPTEGEHDEHQILHNIFTQEIMSSEIRDNLLKFETNSSTLYETFRTERFVTKKRSIFDTIHRKNLKTFKSMKSEKRTNQAKDKGSKKQLAETQKIFDIARVRDYDMKYLLKFELVDRSYLFDGDGLMTKPIKSDLCTELEKHLDTKDYLPPSKWTPENTASIIDVMGCLRRMRLASVKTFGELCTNFLDMTHALCSNSNRIDFVFDTYLEGSVKDSERARRCSHSPIDLNVMYEDTPLPVTMDAFWASSTNKAKVQGLIRSHILANPKTMTDVVISAMGMSSDMQTCRAILSDCDTTLPELDVDIEEADARIIPHALHAVNCGATRVVLLSNDTDVMVLALHFWNIFKGHGLKELWIRAGVGNTTRYIPLHSLADRLGTQICKVLIALHHLTGCDSTSKVGTKAAGLKANPGHYLCDFGKDPNDIDFGLVEEFLVNVYKSSRHSQSMDELRYHLYHHSKKTILDLPPTSRSIKGHILRAFYGTYLQLHCLDSPQLDPQSFGFSQVDGIMQPDRLQVLLPDDFPMPCNCTSCATKRCHCRQLDMTCCPYCGCQASNKGCKNPVA